MNKLSSLRTPILFLNSTLVFYIVRLLTGVVTYRYIVPELLGIWASFTTFTTIAQFLRLGIPNGMNRELPFSLGRNDNEKAYQYASTTLFYSFFTILIIIICAVVFFVTFDFSNRYNYEDEYKLAAVVFFITLAVEPYTTYLTGTFRSNDSFNKLSWVQIINAVLNVATIILVVFYGFKGYVIRELTLSISNLVLLHIWRPLDNIKPVFHKDIFITLFKTGFPIFIIGYLASFIDTIPRLFIIKYGTTVELGIYSPIILIMGIVFLIPNTLTSYLYPKFSSAYGAGQPRIYFWKRMKLIMLSSLMIGMVSIVGIYLLIDKVMLFFPNYLPAVPYIKMASFGMIFIGYKLGTTVCVVFKEYKWMLANSIVYGITMLLSIFILYQFYSDILTIVSYALVSASVCMFVFSIIMVYTLTHKTNYEKV